MDRDPLEAELHEAMRQIDGVVDLDVFKTYVVECDVPEMQTRQAMNDKLAEIRRRHPNARIQVRPKEYHRR